MNSFPLLIISLGMLGFGILSGRVQKTHLTAPMAFVLFGLLVSQNFLGWVTIDLESRFIHFLAELTLILVLFTDATRINLKCLYKEHNLPLRLLGIGLPLTLIFGALIAAVLFKQLTFWEGAVLAALLTPTDAALGQTVVTHPKVPVRIRQTLNAESGLNDGLALPFILILMSIADITAQTNSIGHWVQFATLQIILGPLIGILVGFLGGKLVDLGAQTGWMNTSFQKLSALSLSLLAFALAELVGGNGFISAFCAGILIGNTTQHICKRLYEFGETEGQLLSLIIFMIFGGVMVPEMFKFFNWQMLFYALLSLTVIRMVPVALSLMGTRLKPESILFMGWFGPRGLASILFGLVVLEESNLAGQSLILSTVVLTVLLSVFLHGLSAFPLINWYSSRLKKRMKKYCPEEHAKVSEFPVRIPSAHN